MKQINTSLTNKLYDLRYALEECGLWEHEIKSGIRITAIQATATGNDFAQWLQVCFFNVGTQPLVQATAEKRTVLLQAIKFFGTDKSKARLLQILIEVDALM